MMHQATLAYNEPLIRRAALAFVWHNCGLLFVVAIALVAIGLSWLLAVGDYSWHTGSLATTLIFAIAMPASLYFSHYRNVMTKLRNMGAPLAGLEVEDSSFSITTGIGRTTLRWASITTVWCLPGFWLLFFSKAQFFTVPIASLSTEMQAFMLLRVQASGGKVMDKPEPGVAKQSPPNEGAAAAASTRM